MSWQKTREIKHRFTVVFGFALMELFTPHRASSMLSLNKPCDSCNTNNLYRSPSSTCRVYMRACTIARNQANGMFDIVLDARARAHACLSVLVNRWLCESARSFSFCVVALFYSSHLLRSQTKGGVMQYDIDINGNEHEHASDLF